MHYHHKVNAFPHSSQDAEYMSCAENAIWSLLEYFGTKYDIYKPILPSQIINVLSKQNAQRLVPTTGLTCEQIALVLKDNGFSPVIYHKDNPKFKELFNCYIESGFPLITILSDKKEDTDKPAEFCHAIVTVGREQFDKKNLEEFKMTSVDTYIKKLSFYNNSISRYIVNDDNYPNYQIIDFDKPTILRVNN